VPRRKGTSCSARPHFGITYRVSPKVCGACPLSAKRCGAAKARTATHLDDTGSYDRTHAYLRIAHARPSIPQRK